MQNNSGLRINDVPPIFAQLWGAPIPVQIQQQQQKNGQSDQQNGGDEAQSDI